MVIHKIPTKDAKGKPNGWLLPIWHRDGGVKIDQVYVTAITPGGRKGPHLHMKRRGLFCCIKGDVLIVSRTKGPYIERFSGDSYEHALVWVDPGDACAIYNIGSEEALVLNMPSPPWRENDRDEHPVENWNYKPQKRL